jgi:hypothetical protein
MAILKQWPRHALQLKITINKEQILIKQLLKSVHLQGQKKDSCKNQLDGNREQLMPDAQYSKT